jgi:hypothetical protein
MFFSLAKFFKARVPLNRGIRWSKKINEMSLLRRCPEAKNRSYVKIRAQLRMADGWTSNRWAIDHRQHLQGRRFNKVSAINWDFEKNGHSASLLT